MKKNIVVFVSILLLFLVSCTQKDNNKNGTGNNLESNYEKQELSVNNGENKSEEGKSDQASGEKIIDPTFSYNFRRINAEQRDVSGYFVTWGKPRKENENYYWAKLSYSDFGMIHINSNNVNAWESFNQNEEYGFKIYLYNDDHFFDEEIQKAKNAGKQDFMALTIGESNAPNGTSLVWGFMPRIGIKGIENVENDSIVNFTATWIEIEAESQQDFMQEIKNKLGKNKGSIIGADSFDYLPKQLTGEEIDQDKTVLNWRIESFPSFNNPKFLGTTEYVDFNEMPGKIEIFNLDEEVDDYRVLIKYHNHCNIEKIVYVDKGLALMLTAYDIPLNYIDFFTEFMSNINLVEYDVMIKAEEQKNNTYSVIRGNYLIEMKCDGKFEQYCKKGVEDITRDRGIVLELSNGKNVTVSWEGIWSQEVIEEERRKNRIKEIGKKLIWESEEYGWASIIQEVPLDATEQSQNGICYISVSVTSKEDAEEVADRISLNYVMELGNDVEWQINNPYYLYTVNNIQRR